MPLASLDHLIRSCQHIRRNRQADLLRGLQVDDKLEFRRLLQREISGESRLKTNSLSNKLYRFPKRTFSFQVFL
jgi:hypothetical protein